MPAQIIANGNQAWTDDANRMAQILWRYGDAEDEIWVTEVGCLTDGPCHTAGYMYAYMTHIVDWFNAEGRWVDRYAWYTTYDASFEYSNLLAATVIPASTQPVPQQTLVYSEPGNYYQAVTPNAPLPKPEFHQPAHKNFLPTIFRSKIPTATPTSTPTPAAP